MAVRPLPWKIHVNSDTLIDSLHRLQSLCHKTDYEQCLIIVDGLQTIRHLFHKINPDVLASVRKLRLIIDQNALSTGQKMILEVLQRIANCPPARRLENIALRWTRKPPINHKIGKRKVALPCFALDGFPGLKLSLVIKTASGSRYQVNETLTDLLAPVTVEGPKVNFFHRLPSELREMVYLYLIADLKALVSPVFARPPLPKESSSFESLQLLCRQSRLESLALVVRTRPVACYLSSVSCTDLFGCPFSLESCSAQHSMQKFLERLDPPIISSLTRVELRVHINLELGMTDPLAPAIRLLASTQLQHYHLDPTTLIYSGYSRRDPDHTESMNNGHRQQRVLVNNYQSHFRFSLPVALRLKIALLVHVSNFYKTYEYRLNPSTWHSIGERRIELVTNILKANLAGFKTQVDPHGKVVIGDPFPVLSAITKVIADSPNTDR